VLGGTMASIARATIETGRQPAEPVRQRHAVEEPGRGARAERGRTLDAGRCQNQCVVATIAGSIDTSHAVSTTAATAAQRHFDAESSRERAAARRSRSEQYSM
jgi:hypothetical protein